MSKAEALLSQVQSVCGNAIASITIDNDQVTAEINREDLISVATQCRDDSSLAFDVLIDLCGVDYLNYGRAEWATETASNQGFSRGVERTELPERIIPWDKARFAVAYHLLSTQHNQRLRLKVFLSEDDLLVPSVNDVWSAANWFEREAFDLYGIWFDGHPDLRRILTDYGFVGYPFRKDFPLVGEVEMRYDAKQKRCVYEPVSIEPRTLVPKVFRDDSRYINPEADAAGEKS